MYENTDLSIISPSRTFYQYETIPSLLAPARSFYENSPNHPEAVDFSSSPNGKDAALIPSFQKQLPIFAVSVLALMEILSGLSVLIMEIFIFELAIGLWCGLVYLIAGMAALILVLATDRERHQTSTVLIFQLIALLFAIVEICLHVHVYQKRCSTTPTVPFEVHSSPCQILVLQTSAASLVVFHSLLFVFIYVRLTILVLKQPHGTCNLANALNMNC